MNVEDNRDFTTLSWVKRDLDETFGQAREALEAYVDEPDETDLMQQCADALHQAHGTLRMVELYGAAMVVEEMESLAHALLADGVESPDDAYSVLMRGLMQLPDYLERVQGGHRDVPVALLPLLNDLRAARGEGRLGEAALFAPNLSAELPDSAPGAPVPLPAEQQQQQVMALRRQFQLPLLAWMRNPGDPSQLAAMREILDQVAGACSSTTGRRLWWIAGGVLDGLERGELDAQRSELRPLIGRVDRAIKQLIDGGEMALTKGPAEDLARQMLYYVAQADGDSERLRVLRRTYALTEAVPDAEEIEHAQSAMSGHNRALLDTVSVAIKEDLLKVKDALDIFLRQADPDPADLEPQVEVLDRVSDTLGMLGLPVPSRVIGEQHQLMRSIVAGSHPHDESSMLEVAGALLYVESSLDDHIENLGQLAGVPAASEAVDGPLGAEARRVHDALMAEAEINLGKVKGDIIAFVETPWDHQEVAQIPDLLNEIAGAMRILEIDRPADLLHGIGAFVHNELIVERRVPTAEQMEKLADALASFEYYLEAAREHRSGRGQILDVTQQSLAAIGYWPVPELRTPIEPEASIDAVPEAGAEDGNLTESVSIAPGAGLEDLVIGATPDATPAGVDLDGLRFAETEATTPPDVNGDDDWIEIEEQIEVQVAAGEDEIEGGFQAVSDEIDADIREVFVEEFAEETEGLESKVANWKANLEDLAELKEIRRTFHTLKGSGRLVGAIGVGEFSWKVENMLNRVLDGTIPASAEVVALLDEAVAALPTLLARLQGEETTGVAPIGAIMRTAERLAAGERTRVEDNLPTMRTELRTIIRRVPRPAPDVPADSLVDLQEAPAAEEASAPSPVASAVAAPALPPIDTVLLDILRGEVEQHVSVMRGFCAAHEASETPVRVSEALLRSVHTLSGAVAMVDIPLLVQVLSPLESSLKRLRAHETGLATEGMAALRESAEVCAEVMRQFDNETPQLPETAALVERISHLRDSLPEPPMAHPLFVDADADGAATHEVDEASAHPDLEAVDLSALAGDEIGDFAASEAADFADVTPVTPVDVPAAVGDAQRDEDVSDWLRREIEDAAAAVPGSSDAAVEKVDESDELAALPHDGVQPGVADAAGADVSAGAPTFDADDAVEPVPPAEAEGEGESFADTGDQGASDTTSHLTAEFESPTEVEEADAETGSETDAADDAAIETAEVAGAEPASVLGSDAAQESAPESEPQAGVPTMSAFVDGAAGDDESVPEAGADAETALDAGVAERDAVEPEAASDTAEPPIPSWQWWRQTESATAPPSATADETTEAAPIAPASGPVPAEEVSEAEVATTEPVAAATAGGFPRDPQPDADLELPDLDADLLEVFVDEAGEILDEAEGTMASLRNDPAAPDPVVNLQRGLHTLKGGARMASLAPIGDLAHVMESLLQAVADGKQKATEGSVEALEHGFDVLHDLLGRVRAGRAIAVPTSGIAYFEALLDGRQPAQDAAAEAVEASALPPVAPQRPARSAAPELPELPELPAFEARTSHELIRVRSDLLDTLVNAAGEVSIYRARLEEQTATFRFNLVELEQTTDRLRGQLRKMEIETEAQIIARYQREQEQAGESGFDPLELDRFSQLQQYSRALAESVSDLMSIQGLLDDLTRQSETLLLQQSRVSSELQEGLMRTRMVPFGSMVPSLRRTLRQAAQETGKHAQLRITGAQGEMDRNLLERIKAPFEHMLRNAMAHGIETPEQRERSGKPPEGTVGIDVRRESTEVVIVVSDDGGGIDLAAVRNKAIERGLMKPDADLTRRAIYAFMLETGFSTVSQISKLAGRGVGMDVVASEIKQLGGTLDIDSEAGAGTRFTIRLPFTLAVTQAILVSLGEHTFAVPMTSVEGVARIASDELRQRLGEPDGEYVYAGEGYRLYDLAGLLDMPTSRAGDDVQVPMLMTRTGDQRAAVRVDRVVGSREIVVKPVGPQISSVPGIFGATIMGDGAVVMILDLAPLVRRHLASRDESELLAPEAPSGAELERAERLRPLVMVVDDSITMRKVTTRTLERNDLDALTAKDGLDAVEKLQEHLPDLMLLDIEMPRMDGYELATYMRNDPRLKDVPIIMVTSRTGEKHRQRALELGVKRYLGKPYQEADLLNNIREALADRV